MYQLRSMVVEGSSPCDRSVSSSPATSSNTIKQDTNNDANQLLLPATPSRQYRSKSFDITLPNLKFDDATISINVAKNEIQITPTGLKSLEDELVRFNTADETLSIGEDISQAYKCLENEINSPSDCSDNGIDDKAGNQKNSKLTIRGPGSYIKKLIQQFSEGPFETDDSKPESDRAVLTQSVKDKADAICKKCFHYKGRISK